MLHLSKALYLTRKSTWSWKVLRHLESVEGVEIFRNGGQNFSSSQRVGAPREARKAGKKTILDMNDLPQGLISLRQTIMAPLIEEDRSIGNYPTVVQQAKNNMQKFKHCVLLTRVGSFYELYFEHAEEYGPLLNLKVGSKKTSAGPVAMAGFPFFQLDRFLKVLVQDLGKYVAISEETANDPSQKVKSGGLMFDREVKRVITPGTLIDEHFLDPFAHNYLLAIHLDGPKQLSTVDTVVQMGQVNEVMAAVQIGLAWLDLSSGDFFTQSIKTDALSSALARIGPREIVVDKSLKGLNESMLSPILSESGHLITYHETSDRAVKLQDWAPMLETPVNETTMDQFTSEEIVSADLLLNYVKTQLPGLKIQLQAPIRQKSDDFMIIDKHSLRGLEVLQTLRDGLFKGSLLQAIRRTSTESGARLLASRLSMFCFRC